MRDSGNGRTIKIPVRTVGRQLPPTQERPRPLLAGPDEEREEVVEARPQVEARDQVEADALDWEERLPPWPAEEEAPRVEVERRARERAERRADLRIREERKRLLGRLLAVADNLERALRHADAGDPLRAGIELTLDDLRLQLAQEGVAPIQALGRRFDPNLHEAVAVDGSGGEEVVEVVQTGYTLDGELLRPARVVVGLYRR
jgi:molecular chaperone GrpE